MTTNTNKQQGGELPKLPETNYNGYGDGSEPLYTGEMMHDYVLADRAQRAASVPAATITLDGHQLRMALDLINPGGLDDREELDNDLTFGVRQHQDDDGKISTGMCCWNDDTDGVLPLDGEYEATSVRPNSGPTAVVNGAEWGDAMRLSGGNRDYHGLIAFTHEQLQKFVDLVRPKQPNSGRDARECCGSDEFCDRTSCPARPGWKPNSGRDAALRKSIELGDPVLDSADPQTRLLLLAEYWKKQAQKFRAAQSYAVDGIDMAANWLSQNGHSPLTVSAIRALAAHPAPSSDAAQAYYLTPNQVRIICEGLDFFEADTSSIQDNATSERLQAYFAAHPANGAQAVDAGIDFEQLRFRFFKDLSYAERNKVFKVFGVWPDIKDEKFIPHAWETKLLRAILAAAKKGG